jgi:hypothetical protein
MGLCLFLLRGWHDITGLGRGGDVERALASGRPHGVVSFIFNATCPDGEYRRRRDMFFSIGVSDLTMALLQSAHAMINTYADVVGNRSQHDTITALVRDITKRSKTAPRRLFSVQPSGHRYWLKHELRARDHRSEPDARRDATVMESQGRVPRATIVKFSQS